MEEIRLDLMVNGKKKTFTQDFVPYRKALEYTEKEATIGMSDFLELKKFQIEFVVSLFDDDDLTYDLLIDGLDAGSSNKIMEIIQFRVLNYERPKENENGELPKELENQ